MHSILWASLLASAGVAVVTTLLIEYLAKPWLEARKDRILDKGRQQRTALNGIRRSTLLSHRLQTYRKEHAGVALLKDRIDRVTADLGEHMIVAFETLNVPESIEREWEYVTSAIHAFAMVFPALRLPDDLWPKFDAALVQLRDFEMLFTTSKWHPWRRRNLIKKIKSSPAPSSFKRVESEGDNSPSSYREDGKEPCP